MHLIKNQEVIVRSVFNICECKSFFAKSFSSISYRNEFANKNFVERHLTHTSLISLFNKHIYAIVVPQFLNPRVCSQVSSKLLQGRIKDYTNAPGIGRIGISFYETTNNFQMEKEYFDSAVVNIQALREIFSPYQGPIDRLRLILDETWPQGAILGIRKGKKMFAGLCRALDDGKGILPHEDKLERDDPLEQQHSTVTAQLAVNLYLQVPEKGGELELYSHSFSTKDYNKLRGDSYGIKRELVPLPVVKIKPDADDLVLFNSRRLHSVADAVGKTRLSVSCFVGYQGKNKPLKIWS